VVSTCPESLDVTIIRPGLPQGPSATKLLILLDSQLLKHRLTLNDQRSKRVKA
jgi:hypothetical protein